jgi:hypothetical protein
MFLTIGGGKMDSKTEQKTFKRKPLSLAHCIFYKTWWNDPEQRNYTLEECKNEENTGGQIGHPWGNDSHNERTYSTWHENKGMKYRCFGDFEKIANCEMALTETKPEVECERFETEKAHPSKALVLKEELRKRFYETDGLCLICQNCLENNLD